ncbi:WD40/YVTN/BNR-like repeat-containing protein [Pseudomonas umsongensis]|uniref:WD40/YVTN/BNR-like repeat-containing protein n=1 Tax=Pseudomonas umsongensis TaxID=198618 RepID=UPI003ECF70D5
MGARELGNPLGNPLARSRVEGAAAQPVGVIGYFSEAPGEQWLPADGRIVQQADYPGLLSMLGHLAPSMSAWTDVTPVSARATMGDIGYHDDVVIIPYTAGVARSTDSGLTWAYIAVGGNPTKIAYGGSGTWVLAGTTGQYRSVDDGITWTLLSNMVGARTLGDVASDGQGVFLVTSMSPSTYINYCSVSLDAGATWSTYQLNNASDTSYSLVSLMPLGGGVWIGVTRNASNIVRSADNGASWSLVCLTPSSFVVGFARIGPDMLVGISYGVVTNLPFSRDNGITWSMGSFPEELPALYSAMGNGNITSVQSGGLGELAFCLYKSSVRYVGWTSDMSNVQVASSDSNGTDAALATNGAGKWLMMYLAGSSSKLRAFSAVYPYDTATQLKLPNLKAKPSVSIALNKSPFIKVK